jgi:hypothetical protein
MAGTITAPGGAILPFTVRTSPSGGCVGHWARPVSTRPGTPAISCWPCCRNRRRSPDRLSVDQQMDPPVLSRLCGQPGKAATVRAGLQPGQFPAAGGVAPGGASRDVDDVAGETSERTRVKTMETTEAVSSDGLEKRLKRHHWRQIAPGAREKPRDARKKVLANRWSRKRITKNHQKGPRWSWARNQM